MKKNILLLLALALFFSASAQNFNGQWKGVFTDKSSPYGGGQQCEYVLELECKGTSVTGSSYTYSSEGGKTYYSICTLTGFIDTKQKYVEVKETTRTKTNWPVDIGNCLQIHRLTYFKEGDSSILKGDWKPAPGQGNCGFGTTMLIRRELKQSFPAFNPTASKSLAIKKPIPAAKKAITARPVNTSKPLVVKKVVPLTQKPLAKAKPHIPVTGKDHAVAVQSKTNIIKDNDPVAVETFVPEKSPDSILIPKVKFEKRNNTVLETISVKNKSVKVDLYDNGEVDGDSISLFYNGKLLLSSKRLSEKPISLNITVEDDVVNELVMYAENLGTIPPNTALMVVTDGLKRYEVRITSDLQKSGVINFVHKPAGSGN